MRKSWWSAVVVTSLVLGPLSFASAQSWRDHRARLCFVREENNGAINGLPSWIHIDDDEYRAAVIGNGAVCFYVRGGTHELHISSTVPYEPRSRNTEACKSRTLKLELKADDDRTFMIEPSVTSAGYGCGWRLIPAHGRNKSKP